MSYPTESHTTTAQTAAAKAREAWETTKEKAGDALETGKRHVREQPVQSLAEVLGFGILIGIAIGWALGHSSHDDYRHMGRQLSRDLRDRLHLD